mgnify:FL=1
MKNLEIEIPSVDDLFKLSTNNGKAETAIMIPIDKIEDFPNHPYQVKDNDEMREFAENIKANGVVMPVIVRPLKEGTYEMISGHRRKRACQLAGIKEIKAIVRELTDEQAIIQMVDSNKQREKILPSEKAFAYKMKLEAIKKQGKRNDLITSSPVATKLNGTITAGIVGEEFGEGKDNVYRYIRLTELIPEILQLVDEEKMKLRPAVEISYLKKEKQEYLYETIKYTDVFPSHPQARQMRKLSSENKLTTDEIDRIMSIEKSNQKEQLKFKVDSVKNYFPKDYTIKQMEDVITKLLQEYQMRWKNKIRDRNSR